MNVTLYKFTKRINSTKQPPQSEGHSFSCQLKDETSFINPILKFSPDHLTSGVFSPDVYNYAYIMYWNRFYYIKEWKFINESW